MSYFRPPNKQSPHRLQFKMTGMDNPWQMITLSVVVGVLAGLVIVLFHLAVEPLQALFLPDNNPENYEGLDWWWRLLLPIGGGLLVGLLFHWADPKHRTVGVVHVMERLGYHQGRLPIKNAVMQFIGAAICILSGHSVGREGPAIHLGATSGSQLGQWLNLPSQSLRILVACGIAGAIAASFNTPLAGVIFAMEVILMEYVITGFIPVIISAVTATAVSRMVFGSAPIFSVPALHLESLGELPYIVLAGIAIGCLAALFIHLLQFFSRRATQRPIWQRTTLAGTLVGICAVLAPQIMGIGYDTANAAMLGNIGIMLLITILFMKILATSAGLGLGLPGGLIGPTLIIGACAGAAMGLIAAQLSPNPVSAPGVYAMIGMAAMMGATLQAPLAALTALLELTANPNIILPAMLAIVAAYMISRYLFGKDSIFITFMRAKGLDYNANSTAQSLRRIGVTQAMDSAIFNSPQIINRQQAEQLLKQQPHWLVVQIDEQQSFIMPASDLARQLGSRDYTEIDLQQMPGHRRQTINIDRHYSLQDAEELLTKHMAEALIVIDQDNSPLGVLTHEDIEEHYRLPTHKI